ncbi:MAG: PD-(D/E)XK nuclease-like domain-containing protein [Vicinamibacterales bacterium]
MLRVAPPAPGIYRGVPFADYTSWDAASNSILGKLARSAAHARAALDGLDVDTEGKRLGRPIHTAVFEPDQLETRYVVAPNCQQKTEKGADCKNAGLWVDDQRGWVCGVHGKNRDDHRVPTTAEVISGDDLAICRGIKASVGRSTAASPILAAPAEFELSLVWVDPETGVTCKGRLDAHNAAYAGGTIADGKSTEDASPIAMERTIYNFGYYRQAAMYLGGASVLDLPAKHFAFIAFEKKPPYCTAVYRILDELVRKGTEEVRALLELYAHCRASDSWPGYPDQVTDIGVPAWAHSRIADRIHDVSQRSAA